MPSPIKAFRFWNVPHSCRKCCIERKILAGGGVRHYECEQELLKDGSRQRDIWGADWSPYTQEIVFESIINIRPSQNNRSMIIQSPQIRQQVSQITQQLLGGL